MRDGFFERVNYNGDINGGLNIFGREGDDTFVLDDSYLSRRHCMVLPRGERIWS